jgi:Ca2+:H+ antiporter
MREDWACFAGKPAGHASPRGFSVIRLVGAHQTRIMGATRWMATGMATATTPWWTWTWPLLAWAILLASPFVAGSGLVDAAAGAVLVATVFAAVHHAEVVAHRTGEPFGTLILAVAVTIIEVALIVSVMVAAPAEKAALARDTVFAAVMIVCNGIVGLCLLWGGARHHEQGFQIHGASAALAVLAALTTLTLILPNVATTAPGPVFSTSQLIFEGIVSLVLYGSFVFIQTVRHRDYFLTAESGVEAPAPPPSNRAAVVSAILLLISLVAVVGLAKSLTPTIETAVARLDVPKAVVGIIIAGLVLLPEGLAALGAARANRLQTSLNLALGSALASIGLTIPAVAVVSIVLNQPLELGLGAKDQVLLALTLLVGVITLGTGRTTVLQGIVHLVIFAVFLFFAMVP